jgi:hypothetical protein
MPGGRWALGSWAPRCHVNDPPAGILEMFGEPVNNPGLPMGILGEGEEMPRPGWEMDHPVGRLAIRARLMRFRPDGTAAYLEARLPGPGWAGTWELSIRGLELERSVDRVRKLLLAAVPLIREWIGRDTTAAVEARGTAHTRHVRRTAELAGTGSAARIGVRIATEEGRERPYSARTVHKWRAAQETHDSTEDRP